MSVEYTKLGTNLHSFSVNLCNYCISYQTVIAVIDYQNEIIKIKHGLTQTSKKHLNQWIKYFKLDNYQKVVIGGNID